MRKSLRSGRIYEKTIIFFGLFIVVLTILMLLRKMRQKVRDCRVRHSKDVPVMWVDHISTEGVLLGVRQVSYIGGVFGYTQVNRDSSCDVLGQSTEIVRCGSA